MSTLGRTIAFMRNAETLYIRGNKYFKTSEPYAITIAGGTTVILRDTRDPRPSVEEHERP